MELEQFNPDLYSSESCLKLITAGFNPKIELYKSDDSNIEKPNWETRLGDQFSKLPDAIWFSPKKLECPVECISTACTDKQQEFVVGSGFRVNKEHQIGSGGFGAVYAGQTHNKRIAAKFINVTSQYRDNVISKTHISVDDAMTKLFDETAFEASIYLTRKLVHTNILKSTGFWFQLSGLERDDPKIELVIATPRCYLNLDEWLTNEPFDFAQIIKILIEVSEALEHLESNNVIHRDVKPANILITDQANPEARLADFGLTNLNVSGFTPGFCAPEQLTTNETEEEKRLKKKGPQLGKTDIYSFGITILLALFGNQTGTAILFTPGETLKQATVDLLKQNRIVSMVTKMLQYDYSKRPSYPEVRNELNQLNPSLATLTQSVKNELKECDIISLDLTRVHVSVIDQPIVLATRAKASMLSGDDRDQKDSFLCWGFSIVKGIRAEFKKWIYQLKNGNLIDACKADNQCTAAVALDNDNPRVRHKLLKKRRTDTPCTFHTALRMADQMNTSNRLFIEILAIVVPRNPNLDGMSDAEHQKQAAMLKMQLEKLCGKSVVRRTGWKQLPTLVAICEFIIARSASIISIDDIELGFETFYHPQSESVKKVNEELGRTGPSWFKWKRNFFQVISLFKTYSVSRLPVEMFA